MKKYFLNEIYRLGSISFQLFVERKKLFSFCPKSLHFLETW